MYFGWGLRDGQSIQEPRKLHNIFTLMIITPIRLLK